MVKNDAFPVKDLEGYLILFESDTEPVVSASGIVEADGTFRVGTNKVDDGAMVGKHRVTLTTPMAEEGKRRPKKVLPARYENFSTSGLVIRPLGRETGGSLVTAPRAARFLSRAGSLQSSRQHSLRV